MRESGVGMQNPAAIRHMRCGTSGRLRRKYDITYRDVKLRPHPVDNPNILPVTVIIHYISVTYEQQYVSSDHILFDVWTGPEERFSPYVMIRRFDIAHIGNS